MSSKKEKLLDDLYQVLIQLEEQCSISENPEGEQYFHNLYLDIKEKVKYNEI